jgi:N-acetylneuraminate synthase
MSDLSEIDSAVASVKAKNLPLTVLQCTSLYPCPPEKVGLNVIQHFRDRYGCDVGLSDHSGTIYPGLAAATVGIELLEVHVTFSRETFGPDVPVSVTTSELRQLVEGVRFIEQMNAHPMDKDGFAGEMKPLRNLFPKSVVARSDLSKGTVLRHEDLTAKKPGTGIPAAHLSRLVGHTLGRSIRTDEMLKESDLA